MNNIVKLIKFNIGHFPKGTTVRYEVCGKIEEDIVNYIHINDGMNLIIMFDTWDDVYGTFKGVHISHITDIVKPWQEVNRIVDSSNEWLYTDVSPTKNDGKIIFGIDDITKWQIESSCKSRYTMSFTGLKLQIYLNALRYIEPYEVLDTMKLFCMLEDRGLIRIDSTYSDGDTNVMSANKSKLKKAIKQLTRRCLQKVKVVKKEYDLYWEKQYQEDMEVEYGPDFD